jgi:hypothetical protein
MKNIDMFYTGVLSLLIGAIFGSLVGAGLLGPGLVSNNPGYLSQVDPNDPIYTNLWTVEGTERDLIFENLAILQERCDALAYGKADKGDK